MKLKTTPIEIMKALIAAHVKKNRKDDEAATMLAIKPMLVETFGEVGAESLLGDRTGKDYYYTIRAAVVGPVSEAAAVSPKVTDQPPKMEIE